jgi:hypothetical protein
MPNATGFRRVQTTARWQQRQAAQRRALIDQPSPEIHGWQQDDDGRWWLPGVTDVYLEDDDRYLIGWALVYDELGGHRMHVPPAMLAMVTKEIMEDNGA